MSYTFTYTTSNIPFGYWMKCEFTSDGSGSNYSATNTDHVVSVGKLAQKIDGLLGEYSLPTMTLTLRNVGHYFSDTLFASGSYAQIRLLVWISYDSGTTWENTFFGVLDLKSVQEVHTAKEEYYTRIFNVTAKHMMLGLKDFAGTMPGLDSLTDYRSGGFLYGLQTSTVNSAATLIMPGPGSYAIQGTPFLHIDNMLYAKDIFDFAYSTIPMYYQGWPLSWGVVNDYTKLEHVFYSATGSGSNGDISKLALGVGNMGSGYRFFTHGGVSGTRAAPYSDTISFPEESKNWYEVARDLNLSLFTIVDPVMSWNAGAPTVKLYHKPRIMGGSASAISGTLPDPISVSIDHSNWVTGISVSTRGLGTPTDTTTGVSSAGQQIIYQTKLMTLANPAVPVVTTWTNLQHLEEVGSHYDFPWMNQMYLYTNPGASEVVRDVHQVKILSSQSPFPSSIPNVNASYGLQNAIQDILYANCPISMYNPLSAKQYTMTFRTLKGSNVADLSILKTFPYTPTGGSTETLLITGIERDIMKNLTTITAYKVI